MRQKQHNSSHSTFKSPGKQLGAVTYGCK